MVDSLGSLSQLEVLKLDRNKLTGTFDACVFCKLSQQIVVNRTDTSIAWKFAKFGESISSRQQAHWCVGKIAWIVWMVKLFLSLSLGALATELGSLHRLQWFRAYDNLLSGE